LFIKAENLSRHYKRGRNIIRAVDNVDLEIDRGGFAALVGASGSGKSTLLNLLSGLDSPTAGTIQIDGKNLTEFNRRELAGYRAKKVGMIFQSFNLLPHHTALGNVELALYFTESNRKTRRKKAEEILSRLGLEERMDHRPADLSGGEQQRVAIARALVKKPEIIFADEPTGNLDKENSEAIGELLRELNRDGITIVMVTHDREMAEKCARNIFQMHYGRIDDNPGNRSDGASE